MKYLIVFLLLFWGCLFMPGSDTNYVRAQSINDKIVNYAAMYNVPAKIVSKVVGCESDFNPNSHYQTNREDSWGLVQINLKAHPNITKEQAIDPDFALNYLSSNISKGNGGMWTCYKK